MDVYEFDETDAALIVVAVIDAFSSLPEMPLEKKEGAYLLAESMLRRAEPKLRKGPEMQHIFDMIAKLRKLGDRYRQ